VKASIESTDVLTSIDGFPVRVWKGTTARGTPFVAFVARCLIEDPNDAGEFEDLVKRSTSSPVPTLEALLTFSTRLL
jgi:hypothetical protein